MNDLLFVKTYLELISTYNFADLLCRACGKFAYVALGRVGDDNSLLTFGNWAGGGQPKEFSYAPYNASCKVAELLRLGKKEVLSVTPVTTSPRDLAGGARYGPHIVAVNNWKLKHAKLLALIILYSIIHPETYLHHVGFRFDTKENMRGASRRLDEQGYKGVEVPADDHIRVYHEIPDTRDEFAKSAFGKYYIENQYFPENQEPAIHWDIITPDPEGMLNFVGGGTSRNELSGNPKPLYFKPQENAPVGAVWIISNPPDPSIMGVMTRKEWWEVK